MDANPLVQFRTTGSLRTLLAPELSERRSGTALYPRHVQMTFGIPGRQARSIGGTFRNETAASIEAMKLSYMRDNCLYIGGYSENIRITHHNIPISC